MVVLSAIIHEHDQLVVVIPPVAAVAKDSAGGKHKDNAPAPQKPSEAGGRGWSLRKPRQYATGLKR
jgi:hypothetical protein